MKKVVIIGAGIGGLSAACRLAHNGFDVHVYEQGNLPGGKAGVLEIQGYRFDTGPSLVTMPFVIEELFKDCGVEMSDYLTIKPLDILCKYFYEDGSIINAYFDTEKFAQEIEKKTEDSAESVRKFLKHVKTIYDLMANIFMFKSLIKLSTYLNKDAVKALAFGWKLDVLRSMNRALHSFFKDEKTIQLFNRYGTYNGSNPYIAPATLNVIAHVENNLGGYYVEKGIHEIPKAMERLAKEKGVAFHYGTKVERIVIEKKKIKGIEISSDGQNELIPSDAVISNADVAFTYQNLLKDQNSLASKIYKKLEPSSSVLVFNWGVNQTFPELDMHNILFSKDYKKEFDDSKFGGIPEEPTIYINISSKVCKNDAPENGENWFVLVVVPHIQKQNWDQEIQRTRQQLLSRIQKFLKVDVSNKIVCEEILSPVTLENKTSSYKGALYGPSSNSKFAAFLRQQNKSMKYKGLYFCGGSGHPGGGIPLVILSGKIASELLVDDLSYVL